MTDKINGNKLAHNFKHCIELAGQQLNAFPWENERAYAQWIAQTYFFVRHTTSFLALSASLYGPKNRPAQYEALSHLREESGHDLILIKDLNQLGRSMSDFAEYPETSAFYQTQYYFIEHEDPVTHLGYSQFLEGLAATQLGEVCLRLEKRYSKKGCQFLLLHRDVDQDHFKDNLQFIDKLLPTQMEMVDRNLQESCYLYLSILNRIQNENHSGGVISIRKAG